jgi:hypothetical protein
LPAPHRAVPAALAALPDGLPMPELFLTRELTDLLTRRYATDVALYASLN